MTRGRAPLRPRSVAMLAAAALACSGAPPSPPPLPRVVSASPTGVVPPDDVTVEIAFSAPVARGGVEDGRLLGLCRREDLRAVLQAAESDTGVLTAAPIVPSQVSLAPDGRRAVLRPERPLDPDQPWAAVLSPRVRSADGRPVLDPEGRSRAFAVLFDTGPARDRTAPRPRWVHPPHGPAPANLARVAVGFDEPVIGGLALPDSAALAVPLPAAADVLGLALQAPLPPGVLRVDVSAVRDAAGNAAAPLEPLAISRCTAQSAPAIAAASYAPGTLSVKIDAELSTMGSLLAEASTLPGDPACGAVPAAPATVLVSGVVLPCPGWDPCAASACPGAVELAGLCPGQAIRVRLSAQDLADHRGPPGPWREVASRPPAASPVVMEVLADADAPEAGGEYVEVANLGTGPLDLAGLALAKHTPTGKVVRCTIGAAAGAVPPGGHALVVGGAYDGRYALPAGTPIHRCGATALAGGLANDRPVALALEDGAGQVLSSAGVAAEVARCTEGALERVHPSGPDAPENWACPGARTPGECNRSTPPAECPRRPW